MTSLRLGATAFLVAALTVALASPVGAATNSTFSTGIVGRDDARGTQLELISVKADGRTTGAESGDSSVSDSGRFVAFISETRGLVEGMHSRGADQVYLRDRESGTTPSATSRTP